ncbi:CHAD/CYTH domain-containing protein [Duganella sp. Leaf126]|uniref:CYTH and CHAD domain-containing protein n=1 Tax=Duganella sp. Leaf126 TaxID=1736266 RepID=UPI0006FB9E75|nr:CYTH and CHAD domain-containing protein [Duganella sp. Leaf126]KQQ45282.1 CHAD/CYTH domain-containing protein [Duganella sp. Leaf126]
MEIELKLLLDPAHNATLMALPLIADHADGSPHRQHLSAHYFDTPDLHLLRHGAGLRVRQEDGVWIQTMKAGGSVQSGLHSRNEWEGPVSRPWPQLGKLRKQVGDDSRWRDMLAAPELKQRLEALFTVEVERHAWQLDIEGSRIELVLDQGHIERLGRRLAINEIELELKDGDPSALFSFALALHQYLPLRVSNVNKAQRGYQLCRETGTTPYRARALTLDADATVAQALQAILGNCLQHIQHNEQAVIDGDDPETLHQMRVGLRRMRSALKLFGDAAPCPPALADDIAWLNGELGAARDADVLLTDTLPLVQANPGGKNGLMALQQLALSAAQAHRSAAAQALRSPRYTQLLLRLGLWMQHLPTDVPDAPLAGFAKTTLQRLHKRLLKRARRMDEADPASIHATRIAAKRARYALQFFQALYREKPVRQYLKVLAAIQSALGQHNDLVVAETLLRDLAERHPEALDAISFARGYLQGLQAREPVDLDAIRNSLHLLRLPRPD